MDDGLKTRGIMLRLGCCFPFPIKISGYAPASKLQWSCSATTELVQFLVSFDSGCFCVLVVFPAALLHIAPGKKASQARSQGGKLSPPNPESSTNNFQVDQAFDV